MVNLSGRHFPRIHLLKFHDSNIYGLYNVCCESLIRKHSSPFDIDALINVSLACPSSTDGVIGLNCTGTQNQ